MGVRNERIVLTFDVGPQSSRALLINNRGEILGKGQKKHESPYFSMEPERFIPPYPSVVPGWFNPEIEIYRGYWLIFWFKKEFAEKEMEQARLLGVSAEELLNRRLKEIPAGCDGLLFQPYFTPNVTMPVARGAMSGFSDQHTRIHLYRAIIEGINFALIDGMRLLEKRAGHAFKEIRLGGGGSQSEEICQITADMFGFIGSYVYIQSDRSGIDRPVVWAMGGNIYLVISAGLYGKRVRMWKRDTSVCSDRIR